MPRWRCATVTAWKSFDPWEAVEMHDTNLVLGGKDFTSRLIVGTGKYSTNEIMRQAHEGSGAEIVTVAVRRGSLPGKGESILDFIDTKRFTLLPNTAACYTADEAIRTAYLARQAGLGAASGVELGCAGGPMNTAIGGARGAVAMARAMRLAVDAGRLAYKAGRIGKKLYATASSPLEGLPDWTS